MKSIADSMMNLNGQRQQDFSILFKVFSKGKDREKKAAGIRKVQMKFAKGCPWQTGNVKAAFPWTSRKHSMVVSILLLILTRPLAKKYLNSRTVKTNVDSLVGKTCIVTEDIDNLRAEGQVTIMGQVWTARSVQDDMILKKDTKVRVKAISGVKLIVEPE